MDSGVSTLAFDKSQSILVIGLEDGHIVMYDLGSKRMLVK